MQVQSCQNTYCQALTTYIPTISQQCITEHKGKKRETRNMQKEQIAEKILKMRQRKKNQWLKLECKRTLGGKSEQQTL